MLEGQEVRFNIEGLCKTGWKNLDGSLKEAVIRYMNAVFKIVAYNDGNEYPIKIKRTNGIHGGSLDNIEDTSFSEDELMLRYK